MFAMRCAIFMSVLSSGHCMAGSAVSSAAVLSSRHDLNLAVEAGPNRRVGFLSEANYKSVHTVMSKKVVPVYFTDTSGLYGAVQSGDVIAGMISGQPNASLFSVFSTDLLSPRTFQMKPGVDSRDLMEAVDAAVVRTHNAGELLKAQEQSPPFQVVEAHTCRIDDPTKIPFPAAATATGLLKDVLTTKKLRVLGYGTADKLPNWHQDGNYQVTPHTGFWPIYMNFFMKHFQAAYGSDIVLERVWMKAGGTDSVLNGTIHMTEPYYIYENLHANRLKKWSHEFGCVVLPTNSSSLPRSQRTPLSLMCPRTNAATAWRLARREGKQIKSIHGNRSMLPSMLELIAAWGFFQRQTITLCTLS